MDYRSSYFLAGYDNKEQAEEAVFFHKEDEKLLKSLLRKVRAQAEAHDTHSAVGAKAAELSSLNEIVGKKLTDAEKEGTYLCCFYFCCCKGQMEERREILVEN